MPEVAGATGKLPMSAETRAQGKVLEEEKEGVGM